MTRRLTVSSEDSIHSFRLRVPIWAIPHAAVIGFILALWIGAGLYRLWEAIW